jgi:hypothetical protein
LRCCMWTKPRRCLGRNRSHRHVHASKTVDLRRGLNSPLPLCLLNILGARRRGAKPSKATMFYASVISTDRWRSLTAFWR